METTGQILFASGFVLTLYNIRQKVSVRYKDLHIRGIVGHVPANLLMILGAFLWWRF